MAFGISKCPHCAKEMVVMTFSAGACAGPDNRPLAHAHGFCGRCNFPWTEDAPAADITAWALGEDIYGTDTRTRDALDAARAALKSLPR